MRKAWFVLALTGLVGATMAAQGCSSDDSKDGELALPGRDPSKDSGTPDTEKRDPPDSGVEPAPDCKSVTLKASDIPACDTCVKDKCCADVLACDKSSDCKALQECIAPCDQDDIICILTCTETHSSGADKLREVGSCAQSKCKVECPAPDAGGDPFDAGI